MKSVSIQLELQGTWCNDWPNLKVAFNDFIYFEGKIEGQKNIKIQAPVLDVNTLIIQHHDKKFGENGQWDTQSNGDTIENDRAIKLLSLTLDDVDVYKYVIDNCPLVTDKNEKFFTDYYGFNGTVQLTFESPVYDWIICNIVKPKTKDSSTLAIETSQNNLFNYGQDQTEIDEIENLLITYAHLFDKPSKI